MNHRDFTTTIVVEQSPSEVYKAINNSGAWWNDDIEGNTDKLNNEWNYYFEDNHRCKLKTIEMIPNKKVVWLVEENYFKFTKDSSEWTGNKITFEISRQGDKTQLVFTQIGLVSTYECYNVCRDAWTGFIQKSLQSLITTGKGQLKWYEPS
ncbi:MAG: SRPBCC domain-containing protein [Ginsengibacter sp.]